ncbi:hypothetical protein [Actinokineospora terrae]|uniref:HNH endonuclease n=1 Tax=Actinokineospora terrae TaxID=155974 RepID=A0A1H9X087_9PSEU|nr:hypothetical protein [Actinokineospora terrae]SES39570.1 hypothetical protein SAMN04487818_11286 [Actinokineospora terrae]
MADRYYTPGVRAALTAFSSRTCYKPGCTAPLLAKEDDRWVLALEIAHIRALNAGGARYDDGPSMSDEARNDFPNLIYLCTRHHRSVDAKWNATKYPTRVLAKWKRDAESGVEQLSSTIPVTADQLEAVIARAMRERDQVLADTVERLRSTDTEAYVLMNQLLAELKDARRLGSIVDPDTVSLLYTAAKNLSHLEDSASRLQSAASKYLRAAEMRQMYE